MSEIIPYLRFLLLYLPLSRFPQSSQPQGGGAGGGGPAGPGQPVDDDGEDDLYS